MYGKTYSAKAAEIEKKWILIDAKDLVVGRLASIIALRLRGKHRRPSRPHGLRRLYHRHQRRPGEFTGRKLDQKVYFHHTGLPGGIKER